MFEKHHKLQGTSIKPQDRSRLNDVIIRNDVLNCYLFTFVLNNKVFHALSFQLQNCLEMDVYELFHNKLVEHALMKDPKFLWCCHVSFSVRFSVAADFINCHNLISCSTRNLLFTFTSF